MDRIFYVENEKYCFNRIVFKELFKETASSKKILIGKLEETIADYVGVETGTIHSWRNKSGPSDIEKIKSLANFWGLKDYKILLKYKGDVMSNGKLTDVQAVSLKKVYDAILDFLDEFYHTDGFAEYAVGMNGCEALICEKIDKQLRKVILSFKKEYFYLKNLDVYEEFADFIYDDLSDICDRDASYEYTEEENIVSPIEIYQISLNKINVIIDKYI